MLNKLRDSREDHSMRTHQQSPGLPHENIHESLEAHYAHHRQEKSVTYTNSEGKEVPFQPLLFGTVAKESTFTCMPHQGPLLPDAPLVHPSVRWPRQWKREGGALSQELLFGTEAEKGTFPCPLPLPRPPHCRMHPLRLSKKQQWEESAGTPFTNHNSSPCLPPSLCLSLASQSSPLTPHSPGRQQ